MTLEHQLVIWMVRIMCVLWGIYCVRKQQLLFNLSSKRNPLPSGGG